MTVVFILVAVVAAVAWAVVFGGRLPGSMSERSCQGKEWRHTFPEVTKAEIREFLSMFVSAFAFRETEKLKLSPSDTVLGIYRALYPSKEWPDALEVETLAYALRKKYAIELAALWNNELTLGRLFSHTQMGRQ